MSRLIIDTHAHLNLPDFDSDLDQVLARIDELGMKVINVGTDIVNTTRSVELAGQNASCYSAIGIHPTSYDDCTDEVFFKLQKLVSVPKVVAVGEIGLDYFRLTDDSQIDFQKKFFRRQLDLAREYKLPVIIHGRGSVANPTDAYNDIITILNDYQELRGVMHAFGGDEQIAQYCFDRDWCIGITGVVTFRKKAEQLQNIVHNAPLENLLIETDCPYLTPEPYRGQRNEPTYVRYVADKIAELKNIPVEQVIDQTTANAQKLFGLQ